MEIIFMNKAFKAMKLIAIKFCMCFIILGSGSLIFCQISLWPEVMLIRLAFNKNGKKTAKALQPFVPAGIATISNLQYQKDDKDAYLDVYYPQSMIKIRKVLPTIMWIHGGGWVSGSKENVANYCKILAAKGFTVIAINYSIAPEHTYPTPVIQANQALDYLINNYKNLHVDPDSIIIAGDSGGAHVAAQLANIISEPSYASEMKMFPSITRAQLSGVILFCGAYDLNQVDFEGKYKGFLKTVLWAYTGTEDFMTDPKIAPASVYNYISSTFPPTFISVGNGDPLANQSHSLARKLTQMNVKVDSLFYPKDYSPVLPHEYQFNLKGDAGKEALKKVSAFLSSGIRK
ncbi:Acetyl esterase/lipase [Chryseobacterium rhizoplanae]|uniref:Acetyl esterase/lipase n=2 Tax=Chryseobacterium rhizoplanae TaxID=1609531 RepID=A0A521DMQ4_9FLAO|nr:Acetyl esterase/lipase [Chryseobacterium rhizoplanae]